ncbi:MAG: transcription termination/antitermination protein NusG, partial [Planctomycetota bacterium]
HDLIHRNISYFLPMSWKVRRRSRRTIRSLLPLFSGYLFFCGEEDQRLELLRTDRVANLIEVEDQEKLLSELVQFEQALRAGAPMKAYRYIKTGQQCRVIAGPLLGLQGVVVKTKGAARLVLQVDMLGQAASVEIDIDMIETVD